MMRTGLQGYYAPVTLREAFEIYTQFPRQEICWLAGGTELKLTENPRWKFAVDIKNIWELRQIDNPSPGMYALGAAVTVQEIAENQALCRQFPFLRQLCHQFGSRQIRERATVGGNICHGSPAGDFGVAFLSLDAILCWQGSGATWQQSLAEFYATPRQDRPPALGYLLSRIILSAEEGPCRGVYEKLGERKALETGLASAAINIAGQDAATAKVRIALGCVAATPIRARVAEAYLSQSFPWNHADFAAAGRQAAAEARPISDGHAGAEYRQAMVAVIVERGLASLMAEEVLG